MGQKVNPIGFRMAVHKQWKSRWFAERKEFGDLLNEDLLIRDMVRAKLKDRTLLPEEGSTWTRIAEAYWKPGEGGAGTFTPNRFPGDRVP